MTAAPGGSAGTGMRGSAGTGPREVARTDPDDAVPTRLTVNGTPVELALPSRVTLADALRDRLRLTGTHVGCEHGVCGMCTVLVDGAAARSCLMLACQADGAEVTTVEGLGSPAALHPLQESFGRHHALQCGFCTPGFLLSAYDLLDHDPSVPAEDLPAELSGVICRCTGYRNIVAAVAAVADAYRPGGNGNGNDGDDHDHDHEDGDGGGGGPRLPPPLNCAAPDLSPSPLAPPLAPPLDMAPPPALAAAPPPALAGGHPDEITLPSGEPTAVVELTRQIPVPVPGVTAVLGDIDLLARCLPGAELTAGLGGDWYEGRARVTLGPVRLSFTGVAHVTERGERRVRVLAQGGDPASGQARADITLTVTQGPGAAFTELAASARLYLAGRIASFGRSLTADVAAQMFAEFAAAIERAATGRRPETARPAAGLRLLAAILRRRLRGLLGRRT